MVTLDQARSVSANFTLDQHQLTVSLTGVGTGTVTSDPSGIDCGGDCTESYAYGTLVTLSALADDGSVFTGWSGAGCSGTGACAVTMDAAKSVSANFDLVPSNQYALSVSLTRNGVGTVSSSPAGINCGGDCSETYTDGTMVTLTAVASTGSTFTGWGGACSGTGACVVTLTAAQNVTATFTLEDIEFKIYLPSVFR